MSKEARLYRVALFAAALLSLGANHPTRNFVVTAPTPQLAREIAEAAEHYRRTLAVDWLGHELPPWQDPCPIQVTVAGHLGAGGATSFMFDNGRPFGWSMSIQGSQARLLDSVLPHEITHMIFATHFGQPLPRWCDEGACTSVEHASEKQKQHDLLINFLHNSRGIAFNHMFAMWDYPPDILPLYAQGHSLARFLIAQGGRRKFVDYIGAGLASGDWNRATREQYGFRDLSELQLTWVDWVRQGCPPVAPAETLVAQTDASEETVPARPPSDPAPETAAPNANQIAAATLASSDGWYARVRDATFAKHTSPAAPATRGRKVTPQPPAVVSPQAVSRPQPLVRPQQRVIEWTRPQPSAAPAAPQPARGSYYLAPAPTGTIWR